MILTIVIIMGIGMITASTIIAVSYIKEYLEDRKTEK